MNRALPRTKNIVISGTNFWNPGDDFVRDGVIRILKGLFAGQALNFLFYNFNADFLPQSKFSGIGNFAAQGDLEQCRDFVDAVVIAGLSAGEEIKDLYRWVIANRLEDRVYLIGAGYENDYVAQHIQVEPEATVFRKAKIIVGRTARKPEFITRSGIPYVHLNCPAILSVPEVKAVPPARQIQRIGFSIQLPHDVGLANHSCAEAQYQLALEVLCELSRNYAVEIIAHHKSEYFHFLNLLREAPVPVTFSSFYQDLFDLYPRYDLVVTTRLHASLFANGHGIPGIIINDTDRHTHTLEGFPHSVWVNTRAAFDREFDNVRRRDLAEIARRSPGVQTGAVGEVPGCFERGVPDRSGRRGRDRLHLRLGEKGAGSRAQPGQAGHDGFRCRRQHRQIREAVQPAHGRQRQGVCLRARSRLGPAFAVHGIPGSAGQRHRRQPGGLRARWPDDAEPVPRGIFVVEQPGPPADAGSPQPRQPRSHRRVHRGGNGDARRLLPGARHRSD